MKQVAALLTFVVLVGCGPEERSPTGDSGRDLPTPVQVTTVTETMEPTFYEVAGTATPLKRSTLEAKTPGLIKAIHVKPGSKVEVGDVLVELEAREAKARLEQAMAVAHEADSDSRRLQKLLSENAATRQEAESAQARALVAQASVREAQSFLENATVRAPYSGIVSRKFVNIGDLAAPGKQLIELDETKSVRVETNLPESLLGKVHVGDELRVRVGEKNMKAVVVEMAPSADASTRSFPLKLDLLEGADVLPGQFVRVLVALEKKPSIFLPRASVQQRGQLEIVFVVQGDRAGLRLVKTGRVLDDRVEILSGVSDSEQVIFPVSLEMRDGQRLSVLP